MEFTKRVKDQSENADPDKNLVKQAFASYTVGYNADDPKIRLKIDHTYRVADLCERIAETISVADKDIAWLSGMLHDVGRFEQVRRYGTFSDANSVDHAALGADLLFDDGLIDTFGTFEDEIKAILEVAIRNHNKFCIDEGISDIQRTYCEILRDADKIDILRVVFETPIEDIYGVSSADLRQASVSEEVKQGFREKRAILRSKRLTTADMLVSHISMIHELVYPVSIDIVRKQGYLDKLLEFDSENEDTRKWFEYMREVFGNSH